MAKQSTARPALSAQSARAIWGTKGAENVRTLPEWRAYARSQPGCRKDGWAGVARFLINKGEGTAYVLGADDTVTRCEYRNRGLYTSHAVSIHA